MPTLIPTAETGARAVPVGLTHVDPAQVLLPTEHEAFLGGAGLNGPFVADLLSDMTAHERGGVALYRSVGGRTNNPVLKQKYGHFENQTVEHVEVLETLVSRLGGDPGYVSPSARATEKAGLNLVESTFLLGGSVDLMTQELVMLDAVLLAEAKDHANWSGLAQLVDVMPEGEVRDAVREAVERVEPEEDEHFGWAQDMRAKLISAQVRSGAVQSMTAKAEEIGRPRPGAVLVSEPSTFGDPEVSEADALDQEREVEPGPSDDEPTSDPEVDEGDALEQSRAVPPPD